MRAMMLEEPGQPLRLVETADPIPGPEQVLLQVHACGVCRTDLHIVDGELPFPGRPLIPGHQIVGTVIRHGEGVTVHVAGDRVGVPWLGWTDGTCAYCRSGHENLCDHARFTGYTLNGGFAEFVVADQRYCFPLPSGYPDLQAAPLLCAGLIGYRAYRMAGDATCLGLYGFGAAAHLLIQVAVAQQRQVYAFTKRGDSETQDFARSLGAVWAGGSDEQPPERLDAAIIFAPVGSLIPRALQAVCKGGTVIAAGIHMSDIPSFSYSLLWEERIVRSVANLTRDDAREFLALTPRVPVQTDVTVYPLEATNQALGDLRHGLVHGAAVVTVRA